MSTKKVTVKDILTSDAPDEVIKKLSFEDGLRILEEIVEQVESGALELDKALLSYERGTMVVEKLREHLSGAEKKLEILSKKKG